MPASGDVFSGHFFQDAPTHQDTLFSGHVHAHVMIVFFFFLRIHVQDTFFGIRVQQTFFRIHALKMHFSGCISRVRIYSFFFWLYTLFSGVKRYVCITRIAAASAVSGPNFFKGVRFYPDVLTQSEQLRFEGVPLPSHNLTVSPPPLLRPLRQKWYLVSHNHHEIGPDEIGLMTTHGETGRSHHQPTCSSPPPPPSLPGLPTTTAVGRSSPIALSSSSPSSPWSSSSYSEVPSVPSVPSPFTGSRRGFLGNRQIHRRIFSRRSRSHRSPRRHRQNKHRLISMVRETDISRLFRDRKVGGWVGGWVTEWGAESGRGGCVESGVGCPSPNCCQKLFFSNKLLEGVGVHQG